MANRLVQNISPRSKKKRIHNYLKNVPSKKRWHLPTNSNNILLVLIEDNNIFELQCLLEHNDFTNKPTTSITHAMLIYIKLTLLNKKERKPYIFFLEQFLL
jgi:hypothetical protein